MVTFFAKQWEEYHTSVFELGAFNVTEAQLITITVYAVTGYFGELRSLLDIHKLLDSSFYQVLPFGCTRLPSLVTHSSTTKLLLEFALLEPSQRPLTGLSSFESDLRIY